MQTKLAGVFLVFSAGAVAGFIQTLVIWICGQAGVFNLLQLPLDFPFQPAWFYQRVTWGGMWGLLFLIPLLRQARHFHRGLLFGLLPALATLVWFLPFKGEHGFFGLNLGIMMPVVVVVFGLIWGALAGALLDRAQGRFADEEE